MLKYYAIYLLFGVYVAPLCLLSWAFSTRNSYVQIVSLIALIALVALVFVVTPMVLHSLKKAKIVALVCFAAIMPFAAYWIDCIYVEDSYYHLKRDVSLAACLYFIGIIITLKNINTSTQLNGLNKRVKVALTVLPFIFMAGYCFYWFT